MAAPTLRRVPRDVHPVAWWVWAIGLAASASFTTNPLVLLILAGVATVVVALRRSPQPWGRTFRLYAAIAVLIVLTRVAFRVLLGSGVAEAGGTVLVHLPEIPLPSWVLGLRLLGDVTAASVLGGLYYGMRLAAVVLCIGAANSLANPKRLLRSVPAALHEVGTALVVAVTVVPQLADSARRVRAAQALRAGDTRRTGRLRRFLVPVLEDAVDRSLRLAAGMDTRGYGRSAGAGPGERRTTGALMLIGLGGLCVGVYAGLDQTVPRWLNRPMVAVGLAAAGAGLVLAGRRVGRTRYRPDPWRWPEVSVMACGVATGWVGHWVSVHQPVVAYPGLTEVPTVSVVALVGAVLGLLAVLAAPPPRESPRRAVGRG